LFSALLKSMRPKQWTKNFLLFAGVIFTGKLNDMSLLLRSVAGFFIFCALSGVVYIINDLKDIESDREHPKKKKRPIAAGKISEKTAFAFVFIIGIPALILSFILGLHFGFCAVGYVCLVVLYSIKLKHYVILDLMLVALGFVIRAVAGIEAIAIPGNVPEITPWFLACTLFLALFLAMCKRRHEIILLNDNAKNHRKVLEEYSPAFLDQMVSVTTSATIISYALWSITGKFAQYNMIYTLPFVIYGIFRYLYNVYLKEEGGAPEVILLKDRSLQIAILLWIITTVSLLYLHSPK
jgi:4-hydroxybenzoate polyprenyltransferase